MCVCMRVCVHAHVCICVCVCVVCVMCVCCLQGYWKGNSWEWALPKLPGNTAAMASQAKPDPGTRSLTTNLPFSHCHSASCVEALRVSLSFLLSLSLCFLCGSTPGESIFPSLIVTLLLVWKHSGWVYLSFSHCHSASCVEALRVGLSFLLSLSLCFLCGSTPGKSIFPSLIVTLLLVWKHSGWVYLSFPHCHSASCVEAIRVSLSFLLSLSLCFFCGSTPGESIFPSLIVTLLLVWKHSGWVYLSFSHYHSASCVEALRVSLSFLLSLSLCLLCGSTPGEPTFPSLIVTLLLVWKHSGWVYLSFSHCHSASCVEALRVSLSFLLSLSLSSCVEALWVSLSFLLSLSLCFFCGSTPGESIFPSLIVTLLLVWKHSGWVYLSFSHCHSASCVEALRVSLSFLLSLSLCLLCGSTPGESTFPSLIVTLLVVWKHSGWVYLSFSHCHSLLVWKHSGWVYLSFSHCNSASCVEVLRVSLQTVLRSTGVRNLF